VGGTSGALKTKGATVGRFQRGWRLTKISWRVIQEQPIALALPLIAAAAEGAVAAGYILGVTGTKSLTDRGVGHYVALYPLLVILTLIATFSNAVVVAIADARLRNAPISLREALHATVGRLPLLIGWSLVSATVGLVLRILEERLPIAGRIAAALTGVAWSLATILVIPVLVVEGVGPVTAVKRSGHLFKERWGESLSGQAMIGLPIFLICLPFVVLGGVVATASVIPGIIILAIAIGVMVAFSGALGGVFQTALYRYATGGEAALASSAFSGEDMQQAFRRRGGRRRANA
jgi:hypothetical protein